MEVQQGWGSSTGLGILRRVFKDLVEKMSSEFLGTPGLTCMQNYIFFSLVPKFVAT